MYIPKDKFDKLREATRGGDERAAAILRSFRNDDGNFSAMLDEYFKPEEVEEPIQEATSEPEIEVENADRGEMSKLERYLMDNDVKEGDDNYDEYVSEFYEMFPGEKKETKIEEVAPQTEPEVENPFTKLLDDEVEAIEGYQKYLNELLPSDMCPERKALITSKINKIIEDERQHIEILKELQQCDGEQL